MSDRRLAGFDAEDIPASYDRGTYDIPYSEDLIDTNLRVTAKLQPGRFPQALSLACKAMEKANPGMLAAIVEPEFDGDGRMVACILTPIPERQIRE